MPQPPKYQLADVDIDISAIGKNVAKLRKKKGLTQQELSQKIGIQQGLLSHYENGRLKLSAEMIIQLAKALDSSTDEILGLNPIPSDSPDIKPSLLKRMQKIDSLPQSERRALLKTIDMFLQSDVD